ncbi:MAG: TadE/TadG family type IV pilus assembly protein [Chloroflexota bacterium]
MQSDSATTFARSRWPLRRWFRSDAAGGQSLVEFALILPILLMLIGGIIQYGVIFATKHSLIQVGRDVGRWAATQDFGPSCSADSVAADQPVTQANLVANEAQLLGYAGGDWNSGDFTDYPDNTALPASPPNTEGVEAVWSFNAGDPCPPLDSTDVAWITVRLTHRAPVLLPGFPYLPGLGTCDSSGCYFVLTTTAMFRMEPAVAPGP